LLSVRPAEKAWEKGLAARMFTRRLVAGGIAGLGWSAILLQLCFTVANAWTLGESALSEVAAYLSFFTVLTNLAIVICLLCAAYEPGEDSFWNWPEVQTALALYILVVAIVYATVLQGLWVPTGIEFLTERFFHLVMPMLYMGFWLFVTPKGSLKLSHQVPWQIYPLAFMCYTLIRGAMGGTYPYPFLNAALYGYEVVFMNSLMLLALFLTLGTSLVLLDWLLASLQTRWQGQYTGKLTGGCSPNSNPA
jgi:hypothetical protein